MYGLETGASSLEVKDRQKKDRLGGLGREVQGSIEGLQAGLSTAQNEGVHIVRAFVGVDGFQVDHVTNHVIFVVNTIATVHVASHARNIEGLAAAVAFDQADHLWDRFAFVHQTAHAQAALQA
jgi:hypothetical protein